ncbi:hypothetical protein EDC01DRAFT_640598 [Geopyxis carbonaria]|nr:hypothetical protein EDC01DRAFT_640598 [Geopyxis carbonaria]
MAASGSFLPSASQQHSHCLVMLVSFFFPDVDLLEPGPPQQLETLEETRAGPDLPGLNPLLIQSHVALGCQTAAQNSGLNRSFDDCIHSFSL